MRVLIIGCGDLGSRVGLSLAALGHTVYGMRRNAAQIPAPITPIAADVQKLKSTDLPSALDALVIALSPDARDEASYRHTYVDGLQAALNAANGQAPKRVWVSSTAVYGDQQGGAVDEETPCAPLGFNGRVLLEAEQLALGAGSAVIRCGGIYGPGREWLIRRARVASTASALRWTNRIHVDDAAALIVQVLIEAWPAQIYNAVDCEPALESVVLTDLAQRVGGPAPHIDSAPVADNKQVSSAKIRRMGFVHQFRSWREGYAALLAQPRGHE